MKVLVVYNAHAGDGVAPDELRTSIRLAGHEVLGMIEPRALGRDLHPATELVVVAGGDGTVRDAALELADRQVPLALLPLGTANNIASSLGILGSLEQLIAAWRESETAAVDLGVAVGPWGSRRFIESVGVGLVADGIYEVDRRRPDQKASRDRALTDALDRFRDVLAGMAAQRCILTLDEEQTVEEVLLVEVLNICAIGPGLRLAASADPTDGLFEVVTAGERHRAELDRYLRERAGGRAGELGLPARRASRVEILGFERIHLDDAIESASEPSYVVRMEHAAIDVLRRRR